MGSAASIYLNEYQSGEVSKDSVFQVDFDSKYFFLFISGFCLWDDIRQIRHNWHIYFKIRHDSFEWILKENAKILVMSI